jgi:molybdate transport system regulatory protein
MPMNERPSSGILFEVAENVRVLDTSQLESLEQAFRSWIAATSSRSFRFSRKRVLLVFLLIRYGGIKLGEALGLDEVGDVDLGQGQLHLHKRSTGTDRVLPLPAKVVDEFAAVLSDEHYPKHRGRLLSMDQGYVRRKFYELAVGCGLSKEMGSPEAIRKSRGVELLRGGMPLPVVQKVLGHSTPALAAEYLDIDEQEVRRTVRHFLTRETARTSARNSFYGKVTGIEKGDIQSMVTLRSIGGHEVSSVITNSSLERLGLREGAHATALIKAPWVLVNRREEGAAGQVNSYQGTVESIERGKLASEFIVRLDDGTEVCAVITEQSRARLALQIGDTAWVSFSEFAAIINVE